MDVFYGEGEGLEAGSDGDGDTEEDGDGAADAEAAGTAAEPVATQAVRAGTASIVMRMARVLRVVIWSSLSRAIQQPPPCMVERGMPAVEGPIARIGVDHRERAPYPSRTSSRPARAISPRCRPDDRTVRSSVAWSIPTRPKVGA